MVKHQLHRKPAIHRRTIRSRRFWRYWLRLGRLCVELGVKEVTLSRPGGMRN